MQIYENRRMLYLTSKYGGMALSVLTLLLYNRYVSDVLSSVKAFDAHLLRSLDLHSNGIDLETEIVAKLSRRREYMFELPVDYKPRSRSAGKKITGLDGLKAIFALFRYAAVASDGSVPRSLRGTRSSESRRSVRVRVRCRRG